MYIVGSPRGGAVDFSHAEVTPAAATWCSPCPVYPQCLAEQRAAVYRSNVKAALSFFFVAAGFVLCVIDVVFSRVFQCDSESEEDKVSTGVCSAVFDRFLIWSSSPRGSVYDIGEGGREG